LAVYLYEVTNKKRFAQSIAQIFFKKLAYTLIHDDFAFSRVTPVGFGLNGQLI
jgi:hypothetical protein